MVNKKEYLTCSRDEFPALFHRYIIHGRKLRRCCVALTHECLMNFEKGFECISKYVEGNIFQLNEKCMFASGISSSCGEPFVCFCHK